MDRYERIVDYTKRIIDLLPKGKRQCDMERFLNVLEEIDTTLILLDELERRDIQCINT